MKKTILLLAVAALLSSCMGAQIKDSADEETAVSSSVNTTAIEFPPSPIELRNLAN